MTVNVSLLARFIISRDISCDRVRPRVCAPATVARRRRAAGDAQRTLEYGSNRAQLERGGRGDGRKARRCVAGQAGIAWLRDHRDRPEAREGRGRPRVGAGGGALVRRAHRAEEEGSPPRSSSAMICCLIDNIHVSM